MAATGLSIILAIVLYGAGLYVFYLIIKAAVRNGIREANATAMLVACPMCGKKHDRGLASCPDCGFTSATDEEAQNRPPAE